MARLGSFIHRVVRAVLFRPLRKMLGELQTPDTISILSRRANEESAAGL